MRANNGPEPARIALLVPREEMIYQAHNLMQEKPYGVGEMRVVKTEDTVMEARNSIARGASIIIARGLQASLIKQYTDIPVVEIVITAQEMALLVVKAKQIVGKPHPVIGVVGFRNMFCDMSYFDRIYDIELRAYYAANAQGLSQAAAQAAADRVDLVIGGDLAVAKAQEAGLPSLFLSITEDSLRTAFEMAQRVAYAMRVEKKNAAQLEALLDYSFSGVVNVEPNGAIAAVNPVMEDILGQEASSLLGKPLAEVFRDIDAAQLEGILDGTRESSPFFMRVQSSQVFAVLAPVRVGGRTEGAILTCHKVRRAGNSLFFPSPMEERQGRLSLGRASQGGGSLSAGGQDGAKRGQGGWGGEMRGGDLPGGSRQGGPAGSKPAKSAAGSGSARFGDGREREESRFPALGVFEDIPQKSAAMKECVHLAKLYAQSGRPLLILGEVGTERRLLAQSIHNAGGCQDGPFLAVGLAGMDGPAQRELLFGGNGAVRLAAGGTLYLEDLEGLEPSLQRDLFQAVRYRAWPGLETGLASGFRLAVASTLGAERLSGLVRKGRLRPDFYYLVRGLTLEVPPLRIRPEDLGDMMDALLRECNERYGRYHVLTQGAQACLRAYPWPGNRIQLESFLDRLVLSAGRRSLDEVAIRRLMEELYPAREAGDSAAAGLPPTFEGREEAAVREALARHGGNRERTAAELGISKATLWRRMKKYGMNGR